MLPLSESEILTAFLNDEKLIYKTKAVRLSTQAFGEKLLEEYMTFRFGCKNFRLNIITSDVLKISS